MPAILATSLALSAAMGGGCRPSATIQRAGPWEFGMGAALG
ncbi:hypothetical protein [Labrys miyagiensis]